MHPILFEIGGFPVYTYGLLLAAAYLLGLQFAVVRGRKRGLNPNQIMDLGIWIIVSALVGAKLMLVVVERDKFGWNWQELLNLFRSAGVFYGGLIAAIAVALWYMWRHKMPTGELRSTTSSPNRTLARRWVFRSTPRSSTKPARSSSSWPCCS